MSFFSRKRGRPSLNRNKKDLGTKELKSKRAMGITKCPINILLEKSLINQIEYESAIRFKKLYLHIFGELNLKSLDLSIPKGKSIKQLNQELESHINKLFNKIVEKLSELKIINIIFNIVIFDIFPRSLLSNIKSINYASFENALINQEEIILLKNGLDIINKMIHMPYIKNTCK